MAERRIPGHITGLYIFAVINLCLMLNISLVNADVIVIDTKTNGTLADIDDEQANFGPDFPNYGLIGRLIYVKPHNACKPVEPPPSEFKDLPWIALIARGDCQFDEKVLRAQDAGFMAAIVHNYEGHNTAMRMAGDVYAKQVHIPSVFVGYTDGMSLAEKYAFNKSDLTIVIKIEEFGLDDLNNYFWPFLAVVTASFVGALIFLVVKLVQCYKERRRNRLTKKALKKLPIRKYKKGDHYDTCAICLEDYEEGEKLRVLPCNHTYHCKCVDPWLTNRKKTCPQCKRCVIPKELRDSDYSSTDEENEGEGSGENTPLLRNNNVPAGQASTSRSGSMGQTEPSVFERSGLPASIEPEVVVIRSGFRQQISSSEEDCAQSDNEEMQGAVGGVDILAKKQEEKTGAGDDAVLLEVDETGESTRTDAEVSSETAGLLKSKRKSRAARNLKSPVGAEGSINATFNSSTSSEDDGASSAKKSKKRKRRNNVV